MARNSKVSQVSEEPQEEMTVVIFKLKGQSGTLQKGFDAINTAFAAFGVQALPPTAGGRLSNGNGHKTVAAILPSETDEVVDEDEIDEENDAIQPAAKTSGKPRQPRKYKFLDEFDLNQSEKPWKEFAAEKAPKSEADKYLIAALWITENANLPEFGITHIFTCFRAAGWPELRDFSQPMRFMKSKKSYFTNPSPKMWKLTGPGLDAARGVRLE